MASMNKTSQLFRIHNVKPLVSPLYLKFLERPSMSWIKDSIKPNTVQHILRTIMQLCKNYANLKHYVRQKFSVKVINASPRRSYFSETLVSQEIFASIGLRKNMFQNFQILAVDNDIYIFAYDFANVGMKPDRNG